MAKYSTGGVGSDSGGACELCGAEDRDLQTATVAGATLQVCGGCAEHGDTSSKDRSGGSDRDDERERREKAARNTARLRDAQQVESGWQENTEYEDDPLPYLVRGYGGLVEDARQDAGIRTDELAAELDIDEDELVAIEQGRAARANVGGSTIEALEEFLDLELTEET